MTDVSSNSPVDSDIVITVDVEQQAMQKIAQMPVAVKSLISSLVRFENQTIVTADAQRALNQALGYGSDNTRVYAKNTADAARNQAILTRRIAENKDQLTALRNALTAADIAQNSYYKQAVANSQALAQSADKIRLTQQIQDSQSLSRNFLNLGKNLQYVGRNLTIGITLPIIGLFRSGLDSFKRLEREIVRFEKVANSAFASDSQFKEYAKELGSDLDDLSMTYGTARELLQGVAADFAQIGIPALQVDTRTGQTRSTIKELVQLSAEIEILGDVTMEQSRTFVQSLLQQSMVVQRAKTGYVDYALAIDQVRNQLAMFNNIENNTVLSIESISKAIPEMQAVTTQFGLSLDEATAAFAPMIAAGFEVGASANSIKVSLQRLVAPTKQNRQYVNMLRDEIKGFNFEVETGIESVEELAKGFLAIQRSSKGTQGALEFFARFFGVRQGSRMLQSLQELAYFNEQLQTGEGEAATQARNIVNSVNKSLRQSGIQVQFQANSISQLAEISRTAADAYASGNMKLSDAIQKGQNDAADQLKQSIDKVDSQAAKILLLSAGGIGEAKDVYENELQTYLDSPVVKLNIARETFKKIQRELIPVLVSTLEALLPAIKKLAEFIQNLSPAAKQLIGLGLLAVAALGPLIAVFSNLAQVIGFTRQLLWGTVSVLSKIFGRSGIFVSADMFAGLNNLDAFGDKLARVSDKVFFFDGSMKKFQKTLKETSSELGSTNFGFLDKGLFSIFKKKGNVIKPFADESVTEFERLARTLLQLVNVEDSLSGAMTRTQIQTQRQTDGLNKKSRQSRRTALDINQVTDAEVDLDNAMPAGQRSQLVASQMRQLMSDLETRKKSELVARETSKLMADLQAKQKSEFVAKEIGKLMAGLDPKAKSQFVAQEIGKLMNNLKAQAAGAAAVSSPASAVIPAATSAAKKFARDAERQAKLAAKGVVASAKERDKKAKDAIKAAAAATPSPSLPTNIPDAVEKATQDAAGQVADNIDATTKKRGRKPKAVQVVSKAIDKASADAVKATNAFGYMGLGINQIEAFKAQAAENVSIVDTVDTVKDRILKSKKLTDQSFIELFKVVTGNEVPERVLQNLISSGGFEIDIKQARFVDNVIDAIRGGFGSIDEATGEIVSRVPKEISQLTQRLTDPKNIGKATLVKAVTGETDLYASAKRGASARTKAKSITKNKAIKKVGIQEAFTQIKKIIDEKLKDLYRVRMLTEKFLHDERNLEQEVSEYRRRKFESDEQYIELMRQESELADRASRNAELNNRDREKIIRAESAITDVSKPGSLSKEQQSLLGRAKLNRQRELRKVSITPSVKEIEKLEREIESRKRVPLKERSSTQKDELKMLRTRKKSLESRQDYKTMQRLKSEIAEIESIFRSKARNPKTPLIKEQVKLISKLQDEADLILGLDGDKRAKELESANKLLIERFKTREKELEALFPKDPEFRILRERMKSKVRASNALNKNLLDTDTLRSRYKFDFDKERINLALLGRNLRPKYKDVFDSFLIKEGNVTRLISGYEELAQRIQAELARQGIPKERIDRIVKRRVSTARRLVESVIKQMDENLGAVIPNIRDLKDVENLLQTSPRYRSGGYRSTQYSTILYSTGFAERERQRNASLLERDLAERDRADRRRRRLKYNFLGGGPVPPTYTTVSKSEFVAKEISKLMALRDPKAKSQLVAQEIAQLMNQIKIEQEGVTFSRMLAGARRLKVIKQQRKASIVAIKQDRALGKQAKSLSKQLSPVLGKELQSARESLLQRSEAKFRAIKGITEESVSDLLDQVSKAFDAAILDYANYAVRNSVPSQELLDPIRDERAVPPAVKRKASKDILERAEKLAKQIALPEGLLEEDADIALLKPEEVYKRLREETEASQREVKSNTVRRIKQISDAASVSSVIDDIQRDEIYSLERQFDRLLATSKTKVDPKDIDKTRKSVISIFDNLRGDIDTVVSRSLDEMLLDPVVLYRLGGDDFDIDRDRTLIINRLKQTIKNDIARSLTNVRAVLESKYRPISGGATGDVFLIDELLNRLRMSLPADILGDLDLNALRAKMMAVEGVQAAILRSVVSPDMMKALDKVIDEIGLPVSGQYGRVKGMEGPFKQVTSLTNTSKLLKDTIEGNLETLTKKFPEMTRDQVLAIRALMLLRGSVTEQLPEFGQTLKDELKAAETVSRQVGGEAVEVKRKSEEESSTAARISKARAAALRHAMRTLAEEELGEKGGSIVSDPDFVKKRNAMQNKFRASQKEMLDNLTDAQIVELNRLFVESGLQKNRDIVPTGTHQRLVEQARLLTTEAAPDTGEVVKVSKAKKEVKEAVKEVVDDVKQELVTAAAVVEAVDPEIPQDATIAAGEVLENAKKNLSEDINQQLINLAAILEATTASVKEDLQNAAGAAAAVNTQIPENGPAAAGQALVEAADNVVEEVSEQLTHIAIMLQALAGMVNLPAGIFPEAMGVAAASAAVPVASDTDRKVKRQIVRSQTSTSRVVRQAVMPRGINLRSIDDASGRMPKFAAPRVGAYTPQYQSAIAAAQRQRKRILNEVNKDIKAGVIKAADKAAEISRRMQQVVDDIEAQFYDNFTPRQIFRFRDQFSRTRRKATVTKKVKRLTPIAARGPMGVAADLDDAFISRATGAIISDSDINRQNSALKLLSSLFGISTRRAKDFGMGLRLLGAPIKNASNKAGNLRREYITLNNTLKASKATLKGLAKQFLYAGTAFDALGKARSKYGYKAVKADPNLADSRSAKVRGAAVSAATGFGQLLALPAKGIGLIQKFVFLLIKLGAILAGIGLILAPIIVVIAGVAIAIRDLFKAATGSEEFKTRIKETFSKITSFIKAIIKPFADAINSFFGFKKAGKDTGETFSRLAGIILFLFEKIGDLAERVQNTQAFKIFEGSAQSGLTQFINLFITMIALFKNFFKRDMEAAGNSLTELRLRFLYFILGIVERGIPLLQSLFNFLIDAAAYSIKGAILIIKELLPSTADILKFVGQNFVNMFINVIDGARSMWDAINGKSFNFTSIRKGFTSLLGPMGDLAGLALDTALDIGKNIVGGTKTAEYDIIASADQLERQIQPGLSAASARAAAAALQDGADTASEGIVDGIANRFKGFISDAAGKLLETTQKMRTDIANEFSRIFGRDINAPKVLVSSEDFMGILDNIREINNAIAQAVESGGEELGDDVANAVADAIKDAMQKFVDLVTDYLGDQIQKIKDKYTEILEEQKDESLQYFDDQIAAIDALEKAEEKLLRKQEQLAEDRKRMRDRELELENYRRDRALAIYEGRIDDARVLDLQQKKSTIDFNEETTRITEDRAREAQREQRDTVKQILKKQKDDAAQAFDEIIKSYQDFIENIGQYGTYTQEELEEQFKAIHDRAVEASSGMLDAFKDYFNEIPTLINEYTDPTVGFFSIPLDRLIEEARTSLGLDLGDQGRADTLLGVVNATMNQMGTVFSGGVQAASDTTVTQLGAMATSIEEALNQVIEEFITPSVNKMTEELEKFDPEKIMSDALEHANRTMLREYERMVGHTASLVDGIASQLDPLIQMYASLEAAARSAGGAVADTAAGTSGAPTIPWTEAPNVPLNPPAAGNATLFRSVGGWLEGYFRSAYQGVDPEFKQQLRSQSESMMRQIGQSFMTNPSSVARDQILRFFSGTLGGDTLGINIRNVVNRWLRETYNMGMGLYSTQRYNGGSIPKFKYGGSVGMYNGGMPVPGFNSTAVPALLHGGEYIINAKAVSNIGMATLNSLNNMRFANMRMSNPQQYGSVNTTNTTHIYVENFIGQDEWFNTMMREYNVKVVPVNQKAAGVQSRNISSYNGINKGI